MGEISDYGRPDTALCDYDFPRPPHLGPIWALAHIIGLRINWVRYDRTKHGWHVIIRFNRKMEPGELIAIQSVLGSDYRRETLNLMRILSKNGKSRWGRKHFNILFSRKLY